MSSNENLPDKGGTALYPPAGGEISVMDIEDHFNDTFIETNLLQTRSSTPGQENNEIPPKQQKSDIRENKKRKVDNSPPLLNQANSRTLQPNAQSRTEPTQDSEPVTSQSQEDQFQSQSQTQDNDHWRKLKANRYDENAHKPYVVMIQGTARPDGSVGNVGKLHHLCIARMLHMRYLSISDVKKLGRNKVKVEFEDRREANELVEDRFLEEK